MIRQDILRFFLFFLHFYCPRNREGHKSIRADAADRHAAKALELKSGMPVLRITRVTFDHSGVPFEYVESIYRGDKYVFNVSLGL